MTKKTVTRKKKATTSAPKTEEKFVSIDRLLYSCRQSILSSGDPQLATQELDRMIDLHKKRAANYDLRIKDYLLGHAQRKYKGNYLGINKSLAILYVIHFSAAQYLEGMKKELGA